MAKFKLIDIMPSSISGDKKVQAICEVLDPYLEVLWEQIDNISIYKNIDKLDHEKLDHLAYQFHVDYYNPNLSLEKKRTAIKNSIPWHRHKGTPWAVEDLLSKMFSETWLKEWFEYGGDPYYFRIYTTDSLSSRQQYRDFFKALWAIKNTRSWLDSFILQRYKPVTYGHYAVIDREKTMYQRLQTEFNKENRHYYGMANFLTEKEITYKFPEVWFIADDGINARRAYYLSGEEILWGDEI